MRETVFRRGIGDPLVNSPLFGVRFINIDKNFLTDRWPSSFTNICFYCCYSFPLKEVNRLGTIQESREAAGDSVPSFLYEINK